VGIIAKATAWAGPGDLPVGFSNRTSTAIGQSVFVLGNLPELGGWNPVRAIKLVPANCSGATCDWQATIALPAGATYEYKFVWRDDCVSCYSNAANIIYEPGGNRTGAVAALPAAPWAGKTVFYFSSWSSVSILYSNTQTGHFDTRPMVAVSNGLWRVDGLNRPGEPLLTFVFTDHAGNYDNPDLVPGRNYETPLDACVVRDGQVFNYWPPATVSTHRVETFFLNSTNLAGRTIRVYLPRGYDQNPTKRYPVLYLHDGQNLFLGMGAFGSWNADTNAAHLIRYGKMRETILVGVDNTTDRLREYTPPGCSPPLGGTALGDKYAAMLVHELKPVMDATYRTLPDAEHTGVMGSSMGGLISTWLGWQYPDTFRRIGAMAASFQVCFPVGAPETARPIRMYLDSGDVNDGLANTIAERDNFLRNGYVFNRDFDHTIGYGHTHSESWWDRRSPRCFTFLFPTSDEPNAILDTAAAPPRITQFQSTGTSHVLTWTTYRLRQYVVEASTNPVFHSGMVWSNVHSLLGPEALPWNYRTMGVTNSFRYLRVRQLPAFSGGN
jgi:enterochelin esterase-like enzyme